MKVTVPLRAVPLSPWPAMNGSGGRPEFRGVMKRCPGQTGTFDVKLIPQTASDAMPGRYSIDKQFHGGIEGSSTGDMLTVMTGVQGSAGYVAMEKVNGTIGGPTGASSCSTGGIRCAGRRT